MEDRRINFGESTKPLDGNAEEHLKRNCSSVKWCIIWNLNSKKLKNQRIPKKMILTPSNSQQVIKAHLSLQKTK